MTPDRQQFETIPLPNGVTLRLHATDAPFTLIHIILPVGNVHAHAGNAGGAAGSAHFLEHLCFERSALYPEKHQFEKLISAAGGDWNAWTNPYFTDYFLQAPAEDVATLLPGFMSHVFAPLLHAEDIATQIGIVLNESGQRKYYPGDDELSHYRYHNWMRIQYYDKAQLFGTADSLNSLTTDSLRTFHQSYLQPGIEVFVGGHIPREQLITLFSALTTTPHTNHVLVEPSTWTKREYHTTTSRDVEAPIYFWGGSFANASVPDLLSIALICDYLTDHDSGTLNTWIRKEQGWSYGVNAWHWYDRDRMGWTIEIPVSEATAVDTIRTELHERVRAALADTTAIETAKRRITKSAHFWYQTVGDRLDRAIEMFVSFGTIPSEAEYRTWLETVTTDDLLRTYEQYFSPEVSGELLALPLE